MSSPLQILNYALGLMGQPGVSFFDPSSEPPIQPETEAGRKTAIFFDYAIRETEGDFPWQEILQTATLAKDGTDHWGRNIFPYGSISPEVLLPTGVFRVNETPPASMWFNPQATDSNVSYEIRGNAVHAFCEDDTVLLNYIPYEPDISKFGPGLVRACAHNLASIANQSVTQNPELGAMITQKYLQIVRPQAQMTEAQYRTTKLQTNSNTGVTPPMGGSEQ